MSINDHPEYEQDASMLTVEGYLQGLGKLSHATGWRRQVARIMAVLIVGPILAIIGAFLATALWSLIH